ncbi:hypothetical protein BAQ48_00190 [Bacillus luti]|uniref:hypothetical protein n=1 Tax=Bacillus luti TaxID=2026191 RepID=UPI0008FE82B3|nr:hypothetical protein [Bacillus luti]OJE52895.1 hypothetical protein BAQ48_00190 [Bacillus luti]
MQLHFESWINEQRQNISEDALVLFEESIICYRVGAYRASFLMSYLGFMKALKDRLLRSEKPDLVDDGKWKNIRKTLNDDNKWETTVFITTQEKEKDSSKYYLISSDLMEEIPYWKKKRNECAHAKDTIISHSHIETFWLFLESNYAKFVVNGGKEALLNKIKQHFDSDFTRPGSDSTYLIKEIPLVVKEYELPTLLQEIYSDYVYFDEIFLQEDKYSFWEKVAYSSDNRLSRAFLKFIEMKDDVFTPLIFVFPDKLIEFSDNTILIRKFWKKLLFDHIKYIPDNAWEVITIILRQGWIPKEELTGFINKLYSAFSILDIPTLEQAKILNENGLLEIIKKNIFASGRLNEYGGYNLANEKSSTIVYYLTHELLDDDVVKQLNKLFGNLSRGPFLSAMENYIKESPRFILEFRRLAEENSIVLTEFFKPETVEVVSK